MRTTTIKKALPAVFVSLVVLKTTSFPAARNVALVGATSDGSGPRRST
jgi:hypothetical protein